jgi:hypothetical protein
VPKQVVFPTSDDREKSLLADLALHPGWMALRRQLLASREAYYTELGKTLYREPDLLDASDLKSKSAFFRGAIWMLNLPVFEKKAIDRAMAQDEGDEQV